MTCAPERDRTSPFEEWLTLRLRTSRWRSGCWERFLLVAACDVQAAIVTVAVDPREAAVSFGVAVSGPNAIAASDDDLFPLVPSSPAAHADLEGMGLLDGHAGPLILSLLAFPLPDRDRLSRAALFPARHAPPSGPDLSAYGLMSESRACEVLRPRDRVEVPAPPPDSRAPPAIHVRYPRSGATLAVFDFGERMAGDPCLSRRGPGVPAMREAILDWAQGIHYALRPNGIALGGSGWTPRAYRHYGACEDKALRRLQAARLHPAFAPILAHDPALVQAIDDGIPHEGILDATLCRMLRAPPSVRFGKARMRRLRSLPHGLWPSALVTTLRTALRLRGDLLPASQDGWTVFAATAASLTASAANLGLDLDPLFASPASPWREPLTRDVAARAESALERARHENGLPEDVRLVTLSEASDMASRLAATLVHHLMPGRPDEEQSWISRRSLELSGRLLFGGLALDRVFDLSAAWHDGLEAFERTMPRASDDMTWPALFPDFRASPDLVATCLTRPSELRAEGSTETDEAGPGLAHCVGGYVPDCASRRSHIVSFRRDTPDGGRVRVSTAEIAIDPVDGPVVVQHRGARNAPPPYDAETALRHLVSAIRTELLSLDPEALEPVDVPPHADGIDWSDPSSIAASFRAWAPYLPRRVGRAGVEALRRTLAAMEAAGTGGAP